LGISVPSASEYAEQRSGDFSLFPADDYILEVKSVTIQKDKVDIFSKENRVYDGLEVRFRPISFANGDELQDEDGNEIHPNREPLFFDWFDPERVGLKPQPAKARKFFAFATGVELEDRIDIDDFQQLVGKRLIGSVIIKTAANGTRRNKVSDYRPIRTRRTRAAATAPVAPEAKLAPAAAPAIDVAAEAARIFEADELPF